jgi:hypothetical protein
MLAYKDGRNVRLESRNGVNHTRRLPGLAAVAVFGWIDSPRRSTDLHAGEEGTCNAPALADDRAARTEFREMLRGVAMASGK